MKLGHRERMLSADFFHLHVAGGPGGIRRANLIGIETVVVAYAPGALTTVTEMEGDNSVWLARRDPCGNRVAKRSSLVSNLQRVDVNVAAFSADSFFQT